MFNNWLHRNLDFIQEFMCVNDLSQNFTCNFEFKTKHTEVDVDCEALIYFDKPKLEVEIFVSCILENELFPTSFRLKQHELDVEYGVLFLYGTGKKIGAYKITITPYETII